MRVPLQVKQCNAGQALSCLGVLMPLVPVPTSPGLLHFLCQHPRREDENIRGCPGDDELPVSDRPVPFSITSAISSASFLKPLLNTLMQNPALFPS